MDSVNESEDEPVFTEILEYICDGSKSHPIINSIQTRYKIRDFIKQIQTEWKGALLSTQNMGKVLHNLFTSVVKYISQNLPIFGESRSEVSYFISDPRNFSEVTRFSDDIRNFG